MKLQIKRVIIAPDSFKGSLSSTQVADSIERGIKSVNPAIETLKFPIADGGEGTTEALVGSLGGEYRTTKVCDPLMRPIEARYGLVDGGETAIIEMATASGLALLESSERNPMKTTTYGVGELILDALNLGCRKFIVGIGGSATNDGGCGMLQALGFRLLDSDGRELAQGGEILSRIATIETNSADGRLKECLFEVACDVTNPFFGADGAAHIFARQKGATPEMIEALDCGLKNFAAVVKSTTGNDLQSIAGTGAAGGLGGAFAALLGGELRSGIEIVLDAIKFDDLLQSADLVITGEGRLDRQTMMGKVPNGVLRHAQRYGVPVVAIGGGVEDAEYLLSHGFSRAQSICPNPPSLEWAMNPINAQANIERTISQMFQL